MFIRGTWTNDTLRKKKEKKCVCLDIYYELEFTYEYKVFLVDDFVITCFGTFSQSIMRKKSKLCNFYKNVQKINVSLSKKTVYVSTCSIYEA